MPRNGPPSSQTATYQKTEVIQSYLRIWGTYDPIESGASEPKKWGLYGCSVKKREIFEPKATGRNSVAREQKELPEIGWCQNDRNFGGFAALHSDFSVEGPKRAFLALFWAPGGLGSIFFRI